ncbi:lipopolysaccharide biosynthesis protein [Parasphingorhabdus sp.]|uniref:lipopolysaccharide biosynthesis protein n=1 Tax=Parasphingorhabdus sp. TaxID=2709688 RepID=UPI003A945EC9
MSINSATQPAGKATGKMRYVGFLISNVVQKLGQLFLLSLLVFIGSPEDVNRFGLLISFLALAVPVLSLNIHTSIGRVYYDIDDPDERSRYVISCLLFSVLGVSFGTILLSAIAMIGTYDDGLTNGNASFGIVLVITAAVFTINQFFNLLLRLEGKILPFIIFGVTTGLGSLVFSLLGVWASIAPLYAAIVGYSGAQIAAIIVGICFARGDLSSLGLSFSKFKIALAYSSGTLIMAVAQWVVNYSGRWIGASWVQAEELASYTLVGQLLVGVAMMCSTLYESSRSEIIRQFSGGNIDAAMKVIHNRYLDSLKLVMLIFGTGFLTYPFVGFILPREYNFPFIWMIAAFFQMLAYCFSLRTSWTAIGLYRSKVFGVSAIVGAVCNISLALSIGPKFGLSILFFAAGLGLLLQAVITQLVLRKI